MNVQEAIAARRSIRAFQDRPVEDGKLQRVLEAGRLAPSARNLQEWKFVVVRDRDAIRKFAPVCNGQSFVAEAGALIVGCATESDRTMSCGQYAYSLDLAIALAYMSLAAVEDGLGTCWLGAFSEAGVRDLIGAPAEVRVVGILVVGYPAETPGPRPRKPLAEVVAFERFA